VLLVASARETRERTLTQTKEMDAVRQLNRELMAKLNTSRR